MSFTLSRPDPIDGEAVLSLDDAKAQLRVLHSDEDALIEALRDAAIDWVERYCSISFAPRAFVWTGSGFADPIRLPVAPVIAVQSVSYRDRAGADVALAGSAWRWSKDWLRPAVGAPWPVTEAGPGAVTVNFTAGYADALAEAPGLIAAVRMLLGNLYKFRESAISGVSVSEVPMGVTALCAPYRMIGIG
jgi:uncharacterized phiE125 gp8 family phage protein